MADFNKRASDNQLASTSFANWSQGELHVQEKLNGGKFVSGATTLVCAGPPALDMTTDRLDAAFNNSASALNFAFPIGVTMNVSVNQQKQLQRIFEIGSRRSYFIPGRSFGSLGLGRVFYHGPSLLKVLTEYYRPQFAAAGWNDLATLYSGQGDTLGGVEPPQPPSNPETFALKNRPGADDLIINLASDLFDNPIGLMLIFRDNREGNVAAFYAEQCYVASHGFNVGAESMVISESVQMQCERFVPIRLS